MTTGVLQWLVIHFCLLGLMWMPNHFASDNEWAHQAGEWLDIPAVVGKADAIVALGGGSNRIPAAVKLWQDGLSPKLWFTGATEGPNGGNSTQERVAHQAMEAANVPTRALTFLVTTSTWEDAQLIATTAKRHDVDTVLIVTSWYHGRRALCTVRHHLRNTPIQLFYYPVETNGFSPDDWWLSEQGRRVVTEELYKILFYWGYYGVEPWAC